MEIDKQTLYYENGFFSSTVTKEISALLWNEIYVTEWVEDSNEGIYKKIPKWYSTAIKLDTGLNGSKRKQFERKSGREQFITVPQSLKEIGDKLTESPDLEFFNQFYESYELMYLDLWNGSEEIPYHFDTINGADTLVLIYLTEESRWEKEWGGQISLQKKVNDVIIMEQEFNPDSGLMLVINNANPLVRHKVTALKNLGANRYTFSFNIKWF
jgi:hypothetical protein